VTAAHAALEKSARLRSCGHSFAGPRCVSVKNTGVKVNIFFTNINIINVSYITLHTLQCGFLSLDSIFKKDSYKWRLVLGGGGLLRTGDPQKPI
jgi:hypothetical protein